MPGPGGRGRGQPKGESHAGPGRQADGAQGSGTRPNPVAAGGPRRGQATSSVVHSAAQVMTGLVSSGLSLLADMYASDEEGEKQTVIDVDAESASESAPRASSVRIF